jgi:hypothetical protein
MTLLEQRKQEAEQMKPQLQNKINDQVIDLLQMRNNAIKLNDWMGRILIENKLDSLNIQYK